MAAYEGGYDGKIKTQAERIVEAKMGNRPKNPNAAQGRKPVRTMGQTGDRFGAVVAPTGDNLF